MQGKCFHVVYSRHCNVGDVFSILIESKTKHAQENHDICMAMSVQSQARVWAVTQDTSPRCQYRHVLLFVILGMSAKIHHQVRDAVIYLYGLVAMYILLIAGKISRIL